MKIISYKDLTVWQKSLDLVTAVYEITERFPRSELYGLTSQMRRAAISISSNIAEGKRRGSRRDYRHFLLNAFGSGAELETQIEIAKRLPFGKGIDFIKVADLLEEVMKMLNTLIRKLSPNNIFSTNLPPINLQPNHGFTLAEVMIALVILVIGVLAILRVFPVALGYSERSQAASRISILVERKLEEIKSRPYSEVIETYEDNNVTGTEDDLSWEIKLDKVTPANVSPTSEIRRLIMTVS